MASFSLPTPLSLADLAPTADERERMTRFLQRLLQTPSFSAQEGDLAALIESELRTLGFEDVFTDRVGNVIARIGTGSGPTLLFDAHMDTVQVTDDWEEDPFGGRLEDGILYGLGACDGKSSIASMVYAAHRLLRAGVNLHGTLVLGFLVQGEPCEGGALRVLVQEEGIRPDYILLGEPTDLKIMRGHRGRMMFKVRVHGKSSHASSPELGRNAIADAARLIFNVEILAVDLPSDPFLGAGTIAVTHIKSQTSSLNAIPGSCTFYVDRRLTLGETPGRAQAELENAILREGVNADIQITRYTDQSYTGYQFDQIEAFNAWALDEGHPLIQTAARALEAVDGHPPVIAHCPFSTDGVYSMAEAGIPTFCLGPGRPEYAHSTRDQVAVADIARAAHAYALLAAMLLQGNGE